MALFVLGALGACGPRSVPRTRPERPPSEPPTVPVVFVPGVTGVVLQDPKTHKIAWGTGRNLLRPHDDAYGLALPNVHEDPGLPALEPVAPIQEIALFGIHKPIYGPIRTLLAGAGYVQGDLAAPRAGETLFFFNYDWRWDLTESAGILRRQLEELRRVQGKDRLEVDLICQSSGAHLCRYFAKYGGVPLVEAEAGRLPPALSVRRLILPFPVPARPPLSLRLRPPLLRLDLLLFLFFGNGQIRRKKGDLGQLRPFDRVATPSWIAPEAAFSSIRRIRLPFLRGRRRDASNLRLVRTAVIQPPR